MANTITRTNCPCCSSLSIGKVLSCKDYTVSKEIFDVWECESCALRFTQHVPDAAGIMPYYASDMYVSHTDTKEGLINKLYLAARSYTLNWKMMMVRKSLGKTVISAPFA